MQAESQSTFDRDGILRALWQDPIAHVAPAKLLVRLGTGEEYVDLQHLAAGVQRARTAMLPTGGELSRKSVEPATWNKLLGYLRPRV
jgi:hypothetical protein